MMAHGIPVEWITSDAALASCCEALAQASDIAVDTEFMRSNTFYPIAALFQIADRHRCYLVDPLLITNFAPLAALFTNPNVVKVIHACSEDLEVFNRVLQCVPTPLADTQIAAAMLGLGGSLGYAALVQTTLGVELAKEETRSDWLRRPLDDKQQHYAVQDVEYLLAVWDALKANLVAKNRLPWFMEDCTALVDAANAPVDIDSYYVKIKSAWKLSRKELAVLQVLSRWREKTARELNLPRNHVIHEKQLWDIAKRRPQTLDALKKIEDLHPRKLQQFGKVLLELIITADALSPESYPERLPAPLPASERDNMKLLKDVVAKIAEDLSVLPELLVKKSDYEFLVRGDSGAASHQLPERLPERLMGWRHEVVGKPLLAELAQQVEQEQSK